MYRDATFTSAGSKTIFINSGGFRRPRFYGGAFRGTISNITVQEISDWSVSTRRGFAINREGHLEINSSLVEDTGSITYASLTLPTSPFVDGESYKVVITDLNVTSGAFELKFGRTHSSTPARPVITSANNGTYVEYFKAVNTADDITINNLGGTLATLSSISIKKLDPNNRWNNIDGKLTILENGGELSGTDSGQARLYSIPAPTSAGKTYKVSYTVVQNNGTSLQHYDGDSYEAITSTVGDHSFIYTRQGSNNNFILRNPSGASASIILSNIMLQEQKYVASNLKLKSGNYTPFAAGQSSGTFALKNYYRMGDGILDRFPLICDMMQPSLGNEIITNGDFSTSGTPTNTSFTLGWRVPADSTDNVEIVNGTATITNPDGGGGKFFATNGVDSSNVVVSGRLYKLVYTVTENEGCTTLRYHTGSAYVDADESVGTHTIYYVATGTIFLFRNLSTGSTIKLDNVSLKQVNGVPAFMTNMSASNITNDVPS